MIEKKIIRIDRIILKKEKALVFGSPNTNASNREILIGDTLFNVLKQHKKWQMENRLKYGSYYAESYLKKDGSIYTTDQKNTDSAH